MNAFAPVRALRQVGTIMLVALIAGCSALVPKAAPQPSFYLLQIMPADKPAHGTAVATATLPTLVVDAPRAAAGLDGTHLLYVREAHRLEYFAHSEWVDTPAHMLAPLIVGTLERHAAFAAVVSAPSTAAGDLRLETEILLLQQEFGAGASRAHFVLRAYVVDQATHAVLARRDLDRSIAADSEDARGGVVAANRAVQAVLDDLAGMCGDAARNWRPATDARRGR